MDKKILICGILLAFAFLIAGCTKNVYYTSPVESQSPQEGVAQSPELTIEPPVLKSEPEERELVKQWFILTGEYDHRYDEDDIDEELQEARALNLHPWKIYSGYFVLFGEDYGYIIEIDIVKDGPRIREDKYSSLIEEHNGSFVMISPGFGRAATFLRWSDAKEFIDELWSIA